MLNRQARNPHLAPLLFVEQIFYLTGTQFYATGVSSRCTAPSRYYYNRRVAKLKDDASSDRLPTANFSFGFSLGNSRFLSTTGDHVEAFCRECRIVAIEQRQVFISGLWVAGRLFGQDATNPVESCLVPLSHHFGEKLKRVGEVI